MISWIGKTLRILLVSIGIVLLAVVLLVGVVWFKPALLVHEDSLYFAKRFFPEGMDITWDSISTQSIGRGALDRGVQLEAHGVCVEIEGTLSGCASVLRADVLFSLANLGLLIDDLVLRGDRVTIVTGGEEPEVEKPPGEPPSIPEPPDSLLDFGFLTLRPREIAVADLRIGEEWGGEVSLKPLEHSGDHLGLFVKSADKKGELRGILRLDEDGNIFSIALEGNLALIPYGPISAELTREADGIRYDIDWSLGRKGELHAKGSWLGRVIEGHLVTHLYRLTDAVTGVHARDCSFRAAQEKALSLDVQCLAHADFRPVRALGPAAPERLTGEVKASVRLSGKKMSGAVDVALVPFFLSVAEGKGSVSVAMEAEWPRVAETFSFTPKLDLDVRVGRFQDLVDILSATPFAVPRPLNIMTGELHLKADSEPMLAQGAVRVPIALSADLASESQTFIVRSEGAVTVFMKEKPLRIATNVKVVPESVQLVLPEVDVRRMGKFIPDNRFVRSTDRPRAPAPAARAVASEESGPKIEYLIEIDTPNNLSILLVSHLTKAKIPVNLDINVSSDAGFWGTIRLGSVPIELLRRTADLRTLVVKKEKGDKHTQIDGKLLVNYTYYKIYIDIIGSVDSPQVHLHSSPPLEEEQLIAVLLFGRPMDALSTEEQVSSSQMRSAISDGALSLISLYALASTPVESITYNPETKRFKASVRLDSGTSLLLGKGGPGDQSVGLQRRLGSNWFITSEWESSEKSPGGTITGFLEWIRRY